MPWTRLTFQLNSTVFHRMSLWIVGSDLSHWVEQATYTVVDASLGSPWVICQVLFLPTFLSALNSHNKAPKMVYVLRLIPIHEMK